MKVFGRHGDGMMVFSQVNSHLPDIESERIIKGIMFLTFNDHIFIVLSVVIFYSIFFIFYFCILLN